MILLFVWLGVLSDSISEILAWEGMAVGQAVILLSRRRIERLNPKLQLFLYGLPSTAFCAVLFIYSQSIWGRAIFGAFIALSIAIPVFMREGYAELQDDRLVIRPFFRKKVINLTDVTRVRPYVSRLPNLIRSFDNPARTVTLELAGKTKREMHLNISAELAPIFIAEVTHRMEAANSAS